MGFDCLIHIEHIVEDFLAKDEYEIQFETSLSRNCMLKTPFYVGKNNIYSVNAFSHVYRERNLLSIH